MVLARSAVARWLAGHGMPQGAGGRSDGMVAASFRYRCAMVKVRRLAHSSELEIASHQ